MAASSLPTLPGCGRAASAHLDAALAGSAYACGDHDQAVVDALTAAGHTIHRTRVGAASSKRCGDGFDFLAGLPLTAPTAPEADDWHPDWCEVPHRYGDPQWHASPALQVITDSGLTVLRLEQQSPVVPPSLTISHWHTRNDPADDELMPAEPHELVYLRVPAAAELAAHIATLIALDLGGAR